MTFALDRSCALLADVGTPLMWATLLHLTIGNLIIGILEAVIVRFLFRIKGSSLFFWMIAANYVSSITGSLLIAAGSDRLTYWIGGPLPVYHVYRILVVLALLSFLATILIEWPFYRLAFRAGSGGWKRSLKATLVANAASYVLLVAWYALASVQPIFWGIKLVSPQDLPRSANVRVFYISPDGKDICQLRLDGSMPVRFMPLDEPAPTGVLGFSAKENNGQYRLEVQPNNGEIHFVADVGPCLATTRQTNPPDWHFSSFPDDLQNSTSPKWTVYAGGWAAQGISAVDNRTGDRHFIMALEAPWLAWPTRCATILPNDQIIFQLGEQIMWVDFSGNTGAALAAGHGPVVVLDKSEN